MLSRVGLMRNWVGVLFILFLSSLSQGSEMIVSWQANSEPDLKGYKVHYGTASRSYSNVVYVGNVTSKTIDGLDAGIEYFFAVTALDTADNESDYSEEVSATTSSGIEVSPQKPATPTCTVQNRKILLQWSANPESDINGYKVFYGIESGNYSETIDVGNVTTYTTPDLERGRTYYFAIEAYNNSNLHSEKSLEASAFINNDITPPATPVVATFNVSENRVYLQWLANTEPDLAGYKVFYGTESHSPSNIIDVGNKTDYTTPTLVEGNTYYFAVSAYDDIKNESPVSAEIVITIAVDDTIAPSIPILAVPELNQTNVLLTWNAIAEGDLAGYKVYYGTESKMYDVSEDVGNEISYTTEDLIEGTTYYFAVTSYDTAGNESAWSNEQLIKIENVDITAPAIYAVEIRDERTVNVVFTEEVDRQSAETKANYVIQPDITIEEITLDAALRKAVIKTTPHVAGVMYSIFISNIKDLAPVPNTIVSNSTSTYQFKPEDTTPPVISGVIVEDGTHINVLFSEELDRVSAEELVNYNINRNVTVLNAKLHGNLKEVLLTTTLHENHQEHELTINNIKDRAPVPNVIADNSRITYTYHEEDAVAPTVYAIRMIDDTHIDVMFSEKVERTSAEDASNYTIDNNIQVLSASLDVDEQIVHLTTSTHLSGYTYTVTVSRVTDLAVPANTIGGDNQGSYTYAPDDNVAPSLTSVLAIDATHVKVTFNEDIDRQSAEEETNYRINNGISIVDAQLDQNQRAVHLITSDHQAGKSYLLTVNGVQDRAVVPNVVEQKQLAYTYSVQDITPPEIENVVVVSSTSLEVEFSEIVDRGTAENIDNYSINNGVQVIGVLLYNDLKTVQLKTTQHPQSGRYTLTVNEIQDRSWPANKIAANTTVEYDFDVQAGSPGIIVANIDRIGYNLTTISVNDQYYIDRSYVVESIPRDLENAQWIKTANDDRSNTSDAFLTFELKTDATLYIGYDSRAKSVPNWLSSNFTKTDRYIEVSEYAERLNVWKKDCVKNIISLGGNAAEGSLGAESMYVIVIKDNNVAKPPQLDDTNDPESMGPADTYLLHQNYPNPFNAGTEIRYQLPENCHVTLTIYNIIGQEVIKLVDDYKDASHHVIRWDGRNTFGHSVPSGVYFSRLEVVRQVALNNTTVNQVIYNDVRKMILLK